ncbi:MAG: hypothetical protein SPF11_02525, partial [Treponema porcinum]|uniref:hypothetical protein n=1 Tax=Treponema porcinum TaxID=261392 RepID=UPI002A81D95C
FVFRSAFCNAQYFVIISFCHIFNLSNNYTKKEPLSQWKGDGASFIFFQQSLLFCLRLQFCTAKLIYAFYPVFFTGKNTG